MNWTRVFVDIFFLSVILCCISISQLITSCKLDFNHKGVLYYRVIDQTFRLLPHVVENQGLHRPCFSVLSLQGLLIWVAGSRPDPEAHTERASMFSDRLGAKERIFVAVVIRGLRCHLIDRTAFPSLFQGTWFMAVSWWILSRTSVTPFTAASRRCSCAQGMTATCQSTTRRIQNTAAWLTLLRSCTDLKLW